MTSKRTSALLGIVGGSIATLIGLILILAAGIGLVILPWSVATLLSGFIVVSSPERAAKLARFAVIWAALSSLIFVLFVFVSFDIGLFGLLIFWFVVSVPLPLGQWMLTRRAASTITTNQPQLTATPG
ncbi:MAG: hypothetical protein ACRDHN_21730 [Thermomicrobiales bacterium]